MPQREHSRDKPKKRKELGVKMKNTEKIKSKVDKKHRTKQIMGNKMDALSILKKFGTAEGAPKIVVCIYLLSISSKIISPFFRVQLSLVCGMHSL